MNVISIVTVTLGFLLIGIGFVRGIYKLCRREELD